MSKKLNRKQNACSLPLKDKVNFKQNWQYTKGLTTRERKRMEKKNVQKKCTK
jgi:hypothetical protein